MNAFMPPANGFGATFWRNASAFAASGPIAAFTSGQSSGLPGQGFQGRSKRFRSSRYAGAMSVKSQPDLAIAGGGGGPARGPVLDHALPRDGSPAVASQISFGAKTRFPLNTSPS